MARLEEQAALVVLLRRASRGWADITEAIEEAGSARAVLNGRFAPGGDPGQETLFPSDAALGPEMAVAAGDIERWSSAGIRLVTILDEEYPAQLLTVHQRPPLLFMRGTRSKADERAVAVVGTRNASDRGLAQATAIARGLAEQDVPVVSGLARGIDKAAHIAALSVGGRTVAVIGTGITRAYPAENAALQERIATEGLVISQFWPEAPPTKVSFPMRNAIMSGYTVATVVVEAAYRSGARMQARLALEHNRRVFLLKSLLEHEWARSYATRPNVTVAGDVDEVLAHLDQLSRPIDDLAWA